MPSSQIKTQTYPTILSILAKGMGLAGSIESRVLDAAVGNEGGVSRIEMRSMM